MKQKFQNLFLLFMMITVGVKAQIKFENGYIIRNNGEKVNCLIKNVDWNDNPDKISYKLSENSNSITVGTDSIKEFGVYNQSKYKRFRVDIDRSLEEVSKLSITEKPVYKKETLFLKPLVEGKIVLYGYQDGNLERFFYSTDGDTAIQLVYKSYLDAESNIKKNNEYKKQLWDILKSNDLTIDKIQNADYTSRDLTRLFKIYNKANGVALTDPIPVGVGEKIKRQWFRLNVRPGIINAKVTLEGTNSFGRGYLIDLNTKQTIRFGVEAEAVMPFNKNKWSIILEPTYRFYKAVIVDTSFIFNNVSGNKYDLTYKVIDIPFGIRHYFFLNDHSKLFINASLGFTIDVGSSLKKNENSFLGGSTVDFVQLGFGYTYRKFGVELRLEPNREVLGEYTFWSSSYRSSSLIFSYRLL